MLRKFVGPAVAVAIVTVAGYAASGDCAQAKAELRKAQAALSSAVRNCDAKSSTHHQCMERNNNNRQACAAQERALKAAQKRKKQARDAYRFAKARQEQACGE